VFNEKNVKRMVSELKGYRRTFEMMVHSYLETHPLIDPSEMNSIWEKQSELRRRISEEHARKYPREDIEEAGKRWELEGSLLY
jgi:predicted RNA-binding protein with EMAP domain